jgi:formamidopyrimidine-DNA glycosylase
VPELPEVEGARRRLEPLLVGRRIERFEVRDPKLWHVSEGLSEQELVGRRVARIDRHAKVLDFVVEGELRLLVHLKIAGQFAYQLADGSRFVGGHPYPLPTADLPDTSTRFSLYVEGGDALHINDQRRFAWARLLRPAEADAYIAEQKYGPDPLRPDFTPHLLGERLRARKGRPIKAALLDQTCLAGLGNIYADESLHGARLHPMTRTADLSERQVAALHSAIRAVLELAVPVGGAYVVNGKVATPEDQLERDFLRAHGRAGQPCPDCKKPKAVIVREFLAGRGTYYCPGCQPPMKERRP